MLIVLAVGTSHIICHRGVYGHLLNNISDKFVDSVVKALLIMIDFNLEQFLNISPISVISEVFRYEIFSISVSI